MTAAGPHGLPFALHFCGGASESALAGTVRCVEGRDTKCAIRAVLVFALIGAAINVAVAWGCAMWAPLKRTTSEAFELNQAELSLSPLLESHWPGEDHSGLMIVRVRARGPGMSLRQLTVLRSSQGRVSTLPSRNFWVISAWTGWPYHSLAGEGESPTASMTGGGAGSVQPVRWRERLTALPLWPMWPGFALNSVLYATACWLTVWAWRLARLYRRRHRGLCPDCGYPVAGLAACPECGKAAAPMGSAPASQP